MFFILIDKNFMEGILAGRQSLNPGIKVRMYLGTWLGIVLKSE